MILLMYYENDIERMITMEQVLINGKKYTYIKDFKHNDLLRKSYNELTQNIYEFDFEQWYQGGYWGSGYIPYSLMDGENIVASVAASIVNCLVLGERKRYIQIGTVMTDSVYRNQGLARYLMEKVIEEYNNKCDMIYLFANDGALEFYPKFGFTSTSEYQYSKTIINENEDIVAEKLDMSLENNKKLLVEKANNSISMSKLTILKNVAQVMFYCTSFMSDNVYYLREENVIVIAEFHGDTLHLQDIFSDSEVDLDIIIKLLTNKEVKTVDFGFTPNDVNNYDIKLFRQDDTTLFVMEDKAELLQDNKLMFPLLSHA